MACSVTGLGDNNVLKIASLLGEMGVNVDDCCCKRSRRVIGVVIKSDCCVTFNLICIAKYGASLVRTVMKCQRNDCIFILTAAFESNLRVRFLSMDCKFDGHSKARTGYDK